MSKQTALDWYIEQEQILGNKLVDDTLDLDQFNNEVAKLKTQAKQMEKEQIKDAIKTEIKLIGNYFDVGKLEQREQGHHIRFTSILKDRFDHYNKI